MKYKVKAEISSYRKAIEVTVTAEETDSDGKVINIAHLKDEVGYSWFGWFKTNRVRGERELYRRCEDAIERMKEEIEIMVKVRDRLNSTDGLSRIVRNKR